MPGYLGNGLALPLLNDKSVYLWRNEPVPASTLPGSLSVAFSLERANQSFYPWGLSFEAWFSGNPGIFEIDILGANNDIGFPEPGNYVQLGNINQVNSSFVGRWDMPSQIWPRYVAGFVKTLTNAVNVTLQVTR